MDGPVPRILWHQRRVNLLGIHGNGEQGVVLEKDDEEFFLPRRPVLWENRKSNLESVGNELESKPCHHLLDLFQKKFLGEKRSSSSGRQTGNEKLEGTSSSLSRQKLINQGGRWVGRRLEM